MAEPRSGLRDGCGPSPDTGDDSFVACDEGGWR